jgi:hypothetical protein
MNQWIALAGGAALALGGAAFAASKPAAPRAATVKAWDVPARHLVGGARGDVGYQVFYTEPAWKAAAKLRPWSTGSAPADPKVDWTRDMVITASGGSKPTAGYGLRITSVQRVGKDIVVRVRETRPAADAITSQVITYPSDAVAVRRLEGPVQFVITTDAPQPPGGAAPDAASTSDSSDSAVTSLAKSLFTTQQIGGIAGLNDAAVIRLYGRPLQPSETPSGARKITEVEVAGPTLRALEQTARDSGFLDLASRYDAEKPFPDQMTRVIHIQISGVNKSVSVQDGAANVPPAFDTMWKAIQDAAQKA